MTDQQHPITPPPKLFRQWKEMPRSLAFEAAYRDGADAELEACCEWLADCPGIEHPELVARSLRAARRPKPPSLKEQALEILGYPKDFWSEDEVDTIRRALEQLDTQAARWGGDQELEACVDWMSGSLPRQAADQLRRVELIDCLKKADWPHRYKVVFQQWMDIAHAALAEPEGEGPTDEQLNDISARLPKPPSNKEQALSALSLIMSRQKGMFDGKPFDIIRKALEALPE